jgi:hypothetical protein
MIEISHLMKSMTLLLCKHGLEYRILVPYRLPPQKCWQRKIGNKRFGPHKWQHEQCALTLKGILSHLIPQRIVTMCGPKFAQTHKGM